MKRWVCFVLSVVLGGSVFGQGSLTPGGAPAPVMKTLDQVEARTPIESLPYEITESGSYYLAANLTMPDGQYTDGIRILASGVTLDLNGFTLTGCPSSYCGIAVPNSVGIVRTQIRVYNGFVQNWGQCGVDLLLADNSAVSEVRVLSNATSGIQLGNNGEVKNCAAMQNGSIGIYVYDGSMVSDCTVRENEQYGIRMYRNCIVRDNLCVENGTDSFDAGIFSASSANIVQDNYLKNNWVGIRLGGSDNEVSGNTMLENTEDYMIAPYNRLSLLVSDLPLHVPWPARLELAGTVYGSQGILIESDHVTIDLNGHALISSVGGTAIETTNDVKHLTVCNGSMQGWDYAIDTAYADNCVLRDLHISETAADAIRVGDGAVVTRCVVSDSGGDGIACGSGGVVTQCSALNNGDMGFNCSMGSVVKDCTARWNDESGFGIGTAVVMQNCSASENGGNGILAGSACRIENNNCYMNSLAGIRVDGDLGQVQNNLVTMNDIGIDVNGLNTLVARNRAANNSTDYTIAGGNQAGTVTGSPVGAGAWDNVEN